MIIRKILLFHKWNFRFSFCSRWSKSSSFSLSHKKIFTFHRIKYNSIEQWRNHLISLAFSMLFLPNLGEDWYHEYFKITCIHKFEAWGRKSVRFAKPGGRINKEFNKINYVGRKKRKLFVKVRWEGGIASFFFSLLSLGEKILQHHRGLGKSSTLMFITKWFKFK